ncbi:MAG: DNA adenine methylase [Spirochaetales bacterium]|nr:DNA adenine methylase [Spirochaetales bacterium]
MGELAGQAVFPFDLDHPYLKKHLIAYIGNKRSLQPLLYRVFGRITSGSSAVFLDPFAGSGSVSRLARYMGCRVLANDWERYAYVLNYAHLCVGESEARRLFRAHGGPQAMLAELNALAPPADPYISRYYAPASTEEADYRTERLFYTRENALIIDAVRSRIEELYPGRADPQAAPFPAGGEQERTFKEKLLLLASLLYQCATHTNTSGVFKACHKGFGGHGRDSLGRILSPVHLEMPVLIDGPADCRVGCQDALEFVRSRPADLCYLDPPYNQHQYGSNYHLLNTIALWDRPEVDNALGEDGRLRRKAAIRRDWIRTRSPYCYRRSAAEAFELLLEAIDARHIVLSYNTEGIIPFEELLELMSAQGRVELFGNEYVKYRGGRQSLARRVHNLEFVLVLDRTRSASSAARSRIQRAVLANRLAVAIKRSYRPERIRECFAVVPGRVHALEIRVGGSTVELCMPHLYRFAPEAFAAIEPAAIAPSMGGQEAEDLRLVLERLQRCECTDRRDEIRVLLGILADADGRVQRAEEEALQRRILWLLRKFAHRKYRDLFEATLSELRGFGRRDPRRFAGLMRGLEQLSVLAEARFRG